ncbi:zinc finger BED domain-containing protein RICESLEEPER 2-like [Carya illinoinensis]|uniref:zinc finger BED domain-containing protein RICESLEEPER 2-like n=1 Tax=Carya illinoinensis TaxID=32201 RepID=UPI001C7261EE|nr:zinc finger BED domain-containing protein RICESLEEPER 2-like [Carya illinoinensis]
MAITLPTVVVHHIKWQFGLRIARHGLGKAHDGLVVVKGGRARRHHAVNSSLISNSMDSTASGSRDCGDKASAPTPTEDGVRLPVDIEGEDEDMFNEENEMADVPIKQDRPPRPSKKRSWTWEHFTKILGDHVNPQARCNHCGKLCGCHSKKQGTSVLIAHLTGSQRYKIAKGLAATGTDQTKLSYETQMATDAGGSHVKKLIIPQYSEKMLRELLAEMIITDEMPFTTVDKKGFNKFVCYLEPRFPMPSRYTVMYDCLKRHLKEKTKMKEMFSRTGQRVSFTTDTWTSIQNVGYMCITAHFIDSEWTLHKRIIGFKEIIDHKGASIGAMMDDCIQDWGIKKVLCITVDNANANDTATEWFKRNTTVKEDIIRGHEFIHIRCCAHIINLIVSEVLKEVDDSITKVRNIVRYVRASPQRLGKFKAIVEQLQIPCSAMLCLDVPTRWNSTYMMLVVAQKYERAFQRMEVEDGDLRYALMESTGGRRGLGAPDAVDWDRVKSFVDFLKLFYDTIMRISGSKYCTANLYFDELLRIHEHLQQSYANSEGLLFATAMRMNQNAEEFIRELRKDIDDLYGQYNNNSHPTPASGSRSSSHSTSSTSSGDYTASVAAISSPLVQRYHQRRASRNIMQCRSKVERYLMEDVEAPSDAFQLLTWWKVHSTKFLILSRIARDVLAIPITTVASESAFSTGGRVLDAYRSSLSASTMEALICTQNWLCEMPIGVHIIDPESYRLESDLLVNPSIVAYE